MFIDKVKATLHAGNGGNGVVSFRHEKFIDRGGPDGGDGGKGGDIVMTASRNQNTLASFRYQKLLKAQDGESGQKRRKRGKSAKDLIVPVPVGTQVLDESGSLLADLNVDGQEVIVAKGGKGGFGNAHFKSSTRQAPRVAEKGERGELIPVVLELKMIADVGLVGLPNAGKSTLLSVISNARPEIADYPFTTLTPNLGVVDINEDSSLLFADIPGLIEGASQGKGLGDDFLRHIERTTVLVHLIDAYQEDIAKAYLVVNQELEAYSKAIRKKPQVVLISKIDGLRPIDIETRLTKLKPHLPAKTPLLAISSQSHKGVTEMLYEVKKVVDKHKAQLAAVKLRKESEVPIIRLKPSEDEWQLSIEAGAYIITGVKIERFAAQTDFGSEPGVQRLRDIMKKMGILRELSRRGIESNSKIIIGKPEIGRLEY